MSKIRVLNSGAMRKLKGDIRKNIDLYKSGSHEWLDELFANKRNTTLSVIDDVDLTLKVDKIHDIEYDAYNAQLLFEAYPAITPAIAAEERIWVTLCHKQFYDYMLKRWPILPDEAHHQTEQGIIEQRYFFKQGPRKSQERNGLSRLWLSAALTHDPGRDDPYELTKIFLQDTNFIMYMFGHTFGSNRNIVQGTMEAILNLQLELGRKIPAKPLKSFTGKLNLLSGVTMLDQYTKQEIRDMAEDHIRSIVTKE